jgi:RNA polymerase sigma factor (sigma-70 family)
VDRVSDALEVELKAARLPFDEFFAAEYRSVVGLAAVLCGHRSVAEELAQEAFVAAFRRWDVVGRYDSPGAWVRRVVANMATSAWRTRVREATALARLRSRRDASGELKALDSEFWMAVRKLPRRQAQCVALRYLEDRPIDEIASVLGIASSTVRVHLHQGRTTLAQVLDEWEGSDGSR